MAKTNFYQKAAFAFNPWDLLALVIILLIFTALAWAATQMSHPFNLGDLLIRFGTAGYVLRYRIQMDTIYVVHLRHYRETSC